MLFISEPGSLGQIRGRKWILRQRVKAAKHGMDGGGEGRGRKAAGKTPDPRDEEGSGRSAGGIAGPHWARTQGHSRLRESGSATRGCVSTGKLLKLLMPQFPLL